MDLSGCMGLPLSSHNARLLLPVLRIILARISLTTDPRPVQWLRILLFLFASALLFAWIFEWDRYQIIIGPKAQILPAIDSVLIFWLLVGQSLVWFLPLLLILGLLVFFHFRRTAAVTLNLFWIILFYYMAADLASVGFAGFHAADYLPHIRDILESPGQRIWQWAGEGLSREATLLLALLYRCRPRLLYLCFAYCEASGRSTELVTFDRSTRSRHTNLDLFRICRDTLPSAVQ